MPSLDHYSTLGVLPDADPVVVRAAYQALAQRYHPDKWAGNPSTAHERMARINEAHRVLGDSKLRSAYDASRSHSNNTDYRSAEQEEFEEAFGDALLELEERWSLAAEIFPDLVEMRDGLGRISKSLALGFVTTLLETKKYNHRAKLASTLEGNFLERSEEHTSELQSL